MVESVAARQGGAVQGIDLRACLRYTTERQTTQGGFCFYAYRPWGIEEPNTPDTLAGVSILQRLGHPVPRRERCVAWLREQQDPSGGYPTAVIGYAALEALRRLGAEPAGDPRSFLRRSAATHGLSGEGPVTRELRIVLKCLELWREHGLSPSRAVRARVSDLLRLAHADDGGYGTSGANLAESAVAVALAREIDMPVDGHAVLAYVRHCERPPYGFNVTPSALSSDLETQRAGLWLLRALGGRLRHAGRVSGYVALCQNASGGFGRAPGAIARLDDTLRALDILAWLDLG